MATLPVIIDASRARVGADQAVRQMNRVKAGAQGAAGGLKSMFLALGGGLILRKAITVMAGFEETMKTVGAVSRASAKDLERLENQARFLGATTRFSAQEAGEGLLFLARAGFTVDEALTALPATLNLASAGVLDLGTAADIVSNILAQFSLKADSTAAATDILVAAANRANVTVQTMAQAFKFVGPLAGALGKGIAETAAAIGILGDSGIPATMAGRSLRQIIITLLNPTTKARKALAAMGVTLDEINPKTNSLAKIFQTLKDKGLDATNVVKLFRAQSVTAALVMSNFAGDMAELTEELGKVGGEAKRVADEMNDTLMGSLRGLNSAFEEVLLAMGDTGFAGGLRFLIDIGADTLRVLAGMEDQVGSNIIVATFLAEVLKNLGIVLAIVVASKSIVFFLGLKAALVGAATAATSLFLALLPIVAIIAAIVGGASLGKWFFDEFKIVQTSGAKTVAVLNASWEFIKLGFIGAVTTIKVGWSEMIAFLQRALADALNSIEERIEKFAPEIAFGLRIAATDLRREADPTRAVPGKAGEIFGERETKPGREPLLDQIKIAGAKQLQELADIKETLRRQLAQIEEEFEGKDRKGVDIITGMRKNIKDFGTEVILAAGAFKDELFPNVEGLGDAIAKEMEKGTAAAEKMKDAIAQTNKETAKGQKIANIVGRSFGQSLESVVFDAASAKDAMKAFLEEVIRQTFRLIVVQQISRALSGGFGGPVRNASGNVFDRGNTQAFAHGGIVGGPTSFPMQGGRTGLMGEAGPEAIMPLQRGRDGRLGVSGGGGNTVNITVNTPDADSFRKSQKQMQRDIRRGLRGN